MKSQNMKICFITTIHQSIDWFVADAAKYFSVHGYDVSYICNMDDAFIERHRGYAKCHNVAMKRGLSPINMARSLISIYRIFRQERFDIVQYATPNASFISSIAAKLAGIKFRVYAFWGMRYEGFSGLKRKVFMATEKLTCSLSTHVRIVSHKNMQIVIGDGICPKEKIGVIGLGGTIGVNTRIFDLSRKIEFRTEIRNSLGISDKSFLYCFVGRLNADKGVNELIEAFREMLPKFNNIKLLLLGMEDKVNPVRQENMEWAKSSGDVYMPGPVPQDMVCRYLAASDVLVHPTYREGFGKIIQEAMAMELPIITTDIPGPSEVIEDRVSGWLVPKADVKALAEAMGHFYDNPDLIRILANNGRKRLEDNFTMEKMVSNIYNEYERITKDN